MVEETAMSIAKRYMETMKLVGFEADKETFMFDFMGTREDAELVWNCIEQLS